MNADRLFSSTALAFGLLFCTGVQAAEAKDQVAGMSRERLARIAPSMNERMWGNPIVQANLHRLGEHGYTIIPPDEGWLACRTVGVGRMAQPADIVATISRLLS